MRILALLLALAWALAACGSLNEGGALGRPGATATGTTLPAPSATAVASATAIAVGTIVPIVPGGTVPPPPPTPAPTASPSPAPGGLTQAQLKYRLIDQFGRLLFCDPDFYPIARADEDSLAEQRFPDIQKDQPTFTAILAHLGIPQSSSYTHDQKLAIYRDWKMLNALQLHPQGGTFVGGTFSFAAIFGDPNTRQGSRVEGSIDPFGRITVTSQTPSGPPPCPICLARGTRIATPSGDIAVEDLRIGDVVWSADGRGARVAAALTLIGSTPVPSTHEVVRLVLDDGRVVLVSPGHPTADGRRVGDLAAGDAIDGARVTSVERVAYGGGATFDVQPSTASGSYWANGVLLGSTLH
jgi:hypothetical protein